MRSPWAFVLACALISWQTRALQSHEWARRQPCVAVRPSSSSLQAADESSFYDISQEEEDDGYTTSPKRQRGRVRPLRRQGQLSSRAQARQEQAQEIQKRQEIAQQDPHLLVDTQYSQVVSPATNRALQEILGIDRMTVVQGRTFVRALSGESLVARARTGTGKSLAFLVPVVERLLAMPPTQFQPGRQIGALIVAPTRELAVQIAETAKDLITFQPTLSVRAVYGGTSIQRDVLSLQERLPSILVATPGRLQDLIQDERIRGRKFVDIMKEISIVVLDEADLLVLGGFAKDILKILSHLPRKRQTMLFSATIPKRLRSILPEVCMTSEWAQIDCVEKEESSSKPRVHESYVALDTIDNYVPFLLALIRQLVRPEKKGGENCEKIMVFFPAVRMVRFFADVMRESMKDVPVWEIHSNLSQSARRRVAESFRRTKNGVLLTSDVSARGMDYPDVDIVVQYGLPNRRDLYLHRIGRTGRAGRSGKALLVLMPFETKGGLGRTKQSFGLDSLSTLVRTVSLEWEEMRRIRTKIGDTKQEPLRSNAEGFVLAFLAYYAIHKTKGVDSSMILSAGESLARSLGFNGLPPLPESLATDLQL